MKENYVWKIAGFDHPDLMKVNESTIEIKFVEETNFDILKIFQEKLHFRYEFVQPLPNKLLYKYDNGTLEGMIAQIIYQEADLSYFSLPMNNDLISLVDYSTFREVGSLGFIAVQRKWSSNWDTISKPFSFQIYWGETGVKAISLLDVKNQGIKINFKNDIADKQKDIITSIWIAIFVSVFVVGFALTLLIKLEQTLRKTRKFCSFKKVIWNLFGTLFGEGTSLDSINRFPSRLLLGIWLLSVMILASCYSQTLMSFMTAPVYEQVPRTFHQLASAVATKRFSCGTYHITATENFKDTSSAEAKILEDHFQIYDYSEIDEIIKRVQNDRFAFISEKNYLIERFKIKLTGRVVINDDSFSLMIMSYIIRKGFPYKEKIDEIVTRLFEGGIIDHLKDKRRFIPSYETHHDILPLSLQDLWGSVVFLIIGYISSVVCFIGEIIIEKRTKTFTRCK